MSDFEDDDQFRLTPKAFELLRKNETSSFSDEELLCLRFTDGREARELPLPTVSEMALVAEWYQHTITNASLLELVLNGDVYVDVIKGELWFSLTQAKRDELEASGVLDTLMTEGEEG